MLLDTVIAGNSLATWGMAIAIACVASFVFLLTRRIAVSRLRALSKRTETHLDDVAAAVLANTRAFFIAALSIRFGAASLTLPSVWSARLHTLVVIAVFAQIGLWAATGARLLLARYRDEKLATDRSAATMVGFLQFIVLLLLWSLVVLLALGNLGVDITALVAGLGVGGIAVALAVQNVLGDLFASLAIVLDKPFELGDFIIVDDKVGSVEHIGLKTTRVRAISGEQLIFSNADLLGARVRNFGRMYQRRIVFGVGVTYDTPRAELERIPALLRSAVEAEDAGTVRFDRSHLSAYGAYSIDFESVYFVTSPDYGVYMDAQQRILLRVHEAFEEYGIEFAFPTQSLLLKRAS
jgi:small-conductance mechanosensitive channel